MYEPAPERMTMERGLRPILDSIDFHGCPICGEEALDLKVNGPEEIIIGPCGHRIDATVYLEQI